MAVTTIEWCSSRRPDGTLTPGYTFNPWVGCTKVSPGCTHCYAETLMAKRYGRVGWGPGRARVRTSAAYWKEPLKWDRAAAAAGERHRVFCASLADVFDPDVPWAWRVDLYRLIEATPHLDWLLLTKRPEHARTMVASIPHDHPNVWIGVSVEDQDRAEERIPILLELPAAVRFLSVEPLLGPVTLHSWMMRELGLKQIGAPAGISWVIVGGESGPNARPMHPAWARKLRDQCVTGGTPFFFKQWGEYGSGAMTTDGRPLDPREFDSYMRWEHKGDTWVRSGDVLVDMLGRQCKNGGDLMRARDDGSFPVAILRRKGKKAAGRLLDGREYNELPAGATP